MTARESRDVPRTSHKVFGDAFDASIQRGCGKTILIR